jgi:16S rRNA processing protein RimM
VPDRESEDLGRVAIGRIVKTQGRKGEVFAKFLTDFPHRFEKLKTAHLQNPQGLRTFLAVQGTWFHKDGVVLKFEGIDTISDAEALVGYDLQVEPTEVMPLPAGTYYCHSLVGCNVYDEAGLLLGQIAAIEDYGDNALLVMKMENHKEVLIPAAKGFLIDIDLEGRRMTVRLPRELLELNP